MLVTDPLGTVLLANQRAAELFGHPSPEALTGRSILALVALSDRERARVALRQMTAG
jgi:PAS domain S-box-containing protein